MLTAKLNNILLVFLLIVSLTQLNCDSNDEPFDIHMPSNLVRFSSNDKDTMIEMCCEDVVLEFKDKEFEITLYSRDVLNDKGKGNPKRYEIATMEKINSLPGHVLCWGKYRWPAILLNCNRKDALLIFDKYDIPTYIRINGILAKNESEALGLAFLGARFFGACTYHNMCINTVDDMFSDEAMNWVLACDENFVGTDLFNSFKKDRNDEAFLSRYIEIVTEPKVERDRRDWSVKLVTWNIAKGNLHEIKATIGGNTPYIKYEIKLQGSMCGYNTMGSCKKTDQLLMLDYFVDKMPGLEAIDDAELKKIIKKLVMMR